MTRRGTTAALLVALLATATALRLYHLGSWGLEGAEIFTLRDSLTTRTLRGSRPLLFFFNYHLIRPTFGLDELGIRILPAVFGILSVPVLYWVTRAAVGARPALFACTLLTFSSLLVYRSQFARYWTLVFLLCSAYPILIYLGLRDGRWGRVALGLVVAVLAILAHPASVLLAGGLGLWMLISALGSSTLQPRVRTALRWALVAVGVIALIVAVRLLPMLESWIATPHMRRLRGPALILSHVDGLTAPVVIAAGAGIIWLARQDRSLALLLAALALVPALFLSLLSYWTAVSTVYLFPTAPVAFIGAGIFLDRLTRLPGSERQGAFASATVLAMLLAGNVPGIISQYRDGGRADFRSAAEFLSGRARASDLVVADQPRTVGHYLEGRSVTLLHRDPGALEAAYTKAGADRGGTLWVVALAGQRGGFKAHKLGLATLSEWLYDRCRLRASYGRARLDWRSNEVQVFECSPTTAATSPAVTPARGSATR